MSKIFNMLKEGLNDILEHQRGKKKLKTRVLEIIDKGYYPPKHTQKRENDPRL